MAQRASDSVPTVLRGLRSNASTAWVYFDSLVFVAHYPGAPSVDDFAEYHADLSAHPGVTGIIVLANNSPPSPAQRGVIQQWFERTKARGAVLTNSLLARGAVTALSWFGVPVAAFSANQFEAGLRYVGLPTDRCPQGARVLNALHAHVRAGLAGDEPI